MSRFEYKIIKHIGTISTSKYGWSKEINIVSWCGDTPKFDIREWSGDHKQMKKGITLDEEELRELAYIICDYHKKGVTAKNKTKSVVQAPTNSIPVKSELKPGEIFCLKCNSRPIWSAGNKMYCYDCFREVTEKKAPSKSKDLSEKQIIERNKEREDREFGVRDEQYVPDSNLRKRRNKGLSRWYL